MAVDASSSSTSRKDWMPFSKRAIALMVAIFIVGEAAGILGAYVTRSNAELSRIFATGAATLFFGSLLGGIVTQLLAEFDRTRLRRASEVDFISNVLADLKSVYDQVDRGRTLIIARQSAKTYGEQMLEFIEAQVKLRNVERALRFHKPRGPVACVRDKVLTMIGYLERMTREYEACYKDISRLQSVYEAAMKKAVDAVASKLLNMATPSVSVDGPKLADTDLPRNIPWDVLREREALADFIRPTEQGSVSIADHGAQKTVHSHYQRCFVDPLDGASHELRYALIAELENRSVSFEKRRTATG